MPSNRFKAALIAAVSSFPLGAATVAQSQNAPFLSPSQAIKAIMDGQPWSARTSNGPQMQITFKPDGTASMRGPMPMALSATWAVKGQEICLNPPMGGTKCLRFRQIAGGFEGYLGDKIDLTLTR